MVDPKRTVVRALGNSLGVILPAPFLHAQNIKRGDVLGVRIKGDDGLVLEKLPVKK